MILRHAAAVTTVAVSTGLDIVVSGAADGKLVLHNLQDGTHLRTLPHPADCSLDKILINKAFANVLVYSSSKQMLYLYSLNGALLGSDFSIYLL